MPTTPSIFIGKIFTRLTVLEDGGRNKHQQRLWRCLCVCGNQSTVVGGALISGNTKSCGCLNHKTPPNATHRMSKSPEYHIWTSMKGRCLNPDDQSYLNYGGRGITICERWRNSFEAFYADMGPKPIGYSIERMDNNGPYAPWNCKWIPRSKQVLNTRYSLKLTLHGRTMVAAEWAVHLGVKANTLVVRKRRGWTDEEALTIPLRGSRNG